MKIKIFSALVVALAALGASVIAQTPPAAPLQTAPAPATPAPAVTAPVAPLVPPGPVVSDVPPASTTAPATNDNVVDLVAFDAVPLTDAVRTLALQAGLNIQFDPKLLSGVAANGQPVPVPVVTEKWHNVTAMQALTALLDNWGWQLIWDTKSRIGRVTAKNPNELEPLIERVILLKYSNPSNIMEEITPTLSSTRSRIIQDTRTHQLIVLATEKEWPAVESLIDKLDTPTREVLIEARLVETTKDISSAKGVDWTGTLANQHVSFGNGTSSATYNSGQSAVTAPFTTTTTLPNGNTLSTTQQGTTTTSTNSSSVLQSLVGGALPNGGFGTGFSLNTAHGISPATAFLNADGVQAVLSFLNTDADTKEVALPRTVALDGVPTSLAVVQNVPVFEQTQSAPASGASQGLATVQPNYDKTLPGIAGGTSTRLNEVGVKLTVTPRIAGPTNVMLELKPEISQKDTLVATETLNGQVNTAPIFDRRTISTTAAVPSGYTLVLGGLDQDTVTKNFTKVPFLGDMPGLGYLFRSDARTHVRDQILIFVTPTIIQDSDFQLGDSSFLDSKAAGMQPMNEKSWDTGEPHDWTKPKGPVQPVYQP